MRDQRSEIGVVHSDKGEMIADAPDSAGARIAWLRRTVGDKGADIVMREALMSGEVERGALPGLLGVSDRQARKVTAELLAVGALKSDTQRAPLRLSFPARLASDWMPGLFPEC